METCRDRETRYLDAAKRGSHLSLIDLLSLGYPTRLGGGRKQCCGTVMLLSNTQIAMEKHLFHDSLVVVSIRVPRRGEVRIWELGTGDQRTVRRVGGVWTYDSIGQGFALRFFAMSR